MVFYGVGCGGWALVDGGGRCDGELMGVGAGGWVDVVDGDITTVDVRRA